jgi:DNA polymerase IIIc chi subunit
MEEPITKRRRVTEPNDHPVKGSDTIQRGINEFPAKIIELVEAQESDREQQRIQIQKMRATTLDNTN